MKAAAGKAQLSEDCEVETSHYAFDGNPILIAYVFHDDRVLLTTIQEQGDDEPIATFFGDILAMDDSVAGICAEAGSISLRVLRWNGELSEWRVLHGLTDPQIIEWIENGTLDEIYQKAREDSFYYK